MSRPYPFQIETEDGGSFNVILDADQSAPAFGEESATLSRSFENAKKHYLYPFTRRWSDPETRFYELKQTWTEETAALSSLTGICMHPAYQQIIGMGQNAIPFIMRELQKGPNLWFWALKAITGEDPVPANKRGRLVEMANTWLLWWGEYKYQKWTDRI